MGAIYSHSNYPTACPYAGAFEAAFEEEAWVEVVHYVEGLTEDLTGLQMVHHFAHLVSADQCHSPSVG